MFGKNVSMPRSRTDGTSLQVQEIFTTMQGEGPNAGTPAFFLRLVGCNLKCFFCDTDFESSDLVLKVDEIIHRLKCEYYQPKLLVITGGEPLRQNLEPLLTLVSKNNYPEYVEIETDGSFYWPFLEVLKKKIGWNIICSPKTQKIHPSLEPLISAYKYIISTSSDPGIDDGLPNKSTQSKGERTRLHRPSQHFPKNRIFLQPCDEQDEYKNKENLKLCVTLCRKFGYRLSLQQHKILGLP